MTDGQGRPTRSCPWRYGTAGDGDKGGRRAFTGLGRGRSESMLRRGDRFGGSGRSGASHRGVFPTKLRREFAKDSDQDGSSLPYAGRPRQSWKIPD
jgi:hypothetical protein